MGHLLTRRSAAAEAAGGGEAGGRRYALLIWSCSRESVALSFRKPEVTQIEDMGGRLFQPLDPKTNLGCQ